MENYGDESPINQHVDLWMKINLHESTLPINLQCHVIILHVEGSEKNDCKKCDDEHDNFYSDCQ